ncbi:MAG: SCO family protein [Gammaproteobacteria bacterium]
MSRRRFWPAVAAAWLLAGCPWLAAEPAPVFDGEAAYALSQAAIGQSVGALRLTRSDGTELRLSELRGKPVLVSFVYTSCYQICSTTTRALARAVRAARPVLGTDSFVVLTVGFDTTVDTPARMAAFAAEQAVQDPGWYFLSGDAASVTALARATGFTYQRSPRASITSCRPP